MCVYGKRIHVVVTLNVSYLDFEADNDGVRTKFTEALRSAAGTNRVNVTVTINKVTMSVGNRRLLSFDSKPMDTIDIHATVVGVVHLRHLKQHMTTHLAKYHVSHTVEHEHEVHVLHP